MNKTEETTQRARTMDRFKELYPYKQNDPIEWHHFKTYYELGINDASHQTAELNEKVKLIKAERDALDILFNDEVKIRKECQQQIESLEAKVESITTELKNQELHCDELVKDRDYWFNLHYELTHNNHD